MSYPKMNTRFNLLNKYLLSIIYVPSSVLGSDNAMKTTDSVYTFMEFTF